MRKIYWSSGLLLAFLALDISSALAQQRVQGYTKKDGTYIAPYTRSTPDRSYNNNYTVQGNTNPYTGQSGTRSPTYNDRSPSYNQRYYGSPGYTNGSRSTLGGR